MKDPNKTQEQILADNIKKLDHVSSKKISKTNFEDYQLDLGNICYNFFRFSKKTYHDC